jgi:dihydroorotate dehydrogenase (fumarate)
MSKPSLSASYLGLSLRSPIVVGSCPMTLNPESVRELSIAGVGAVVLPSLFEEQIVHYRNQRGEQVSPQEARVEWLSYEQIEDKYNGGPQGYVEAIVIHKKTANVPIIASLNGCSGGRWLEFAVDLERAGADAIELSLDPEIIDPAIGGDRVEQELVACVTTLCDLVSIPVSVKISPYHANLSNLAWQLTAAGASGLVGFAHATTWEVCTEHIKTSITWSLTPAGNVNPTIDGLIRLRAGGPSISLAASGGICSTDDITRLVIAGADVVMVTSEFYRAGPGVVESMLNELSNFLSSHHFNSFADFASSRPIPTSSLRRSCLRLMTRTQRYEDPTPENPHQTGDRWGHPT